MLNKLTIRGYDSHDCITGKDYSGPIEINFKRGINYVDPRVLHILKLLNSSLRTSIGVKGKIGLGTNIDISNGINIKLQYNEVNYYELILIKDVNATDNSLCVLSESLGNGVLTKTYDYLIEGWDNKIPVTRNIPIVSLFNNLEMHELSHSFTYIEENKDPRYHTLDQLRRYLNNYYNVPIQCIDEAWAMMPSLDLGIKKIEVGIGKDNAYIDESGKNEFKIESLSMLGSGANLLLWLLPILLQKDKTVILSSRLCSFTELHPILVKHLINILNNTEGICTVLLEKDEFTKY